MAEFKVGDRVIGTPGFKKEEKEGTIFCRYLDGIGGVTWTVDFPGWNEGHDGYGFGSMSIIKSRWNCNASGLRLVPVSPTTHLIIIASDGAAQHPHKHPTRDAAMLEAKRLANLKPTINFTVYQAVAEATADRPTVNVVDFA